MTGWFLGKNQCFRQCLSNLPNDFEEQTDLSGWQAQEIIDHHDKRQQVLFNIRQ